MASSAGTRLIDRYKFVNAFPAALPSTSTSAYVNLANYNHATIIIDVANATTVTGSAITLNQASAVAGTGVKALGFTTVWKNLDVSATDTLVSTAVVANTFTTLTTNSKNSQYIIEVNASDLDVANNFTCLQVALATGVAMTANVEIILSGARFGGNVAQMPSGIL